MRIVLTCALTLASPVAAWEFSPIPVCTLSDARTAAKVVVTWDPKRAEPYAIDVTGPATWPNAPVFALRFDGHRSLIISTDRQRISDDGRTLTVTDTGFGNVLDGLEFNDVATAILDASKMSVPLDGAAPAVEAFRACTTAPSA